MLALSLLAFFVWLAFSLGGALLNPALGVHSVLASPSGDALTGERAS